eukprot:128879_1
MTQKKHSSGTHKKTRRQRTINNASIDIDDVFIGSGLGYINWLKIAKKKLMDRELIMLHKRQMILDALVISSIRQMAHDNPNTFNVQICFHVYQSEIRHKLIDSQSAIMSLCALSISKMLQKWNGYKGKKGIRLILFRNYFRHCRHWFDTNKATIMAINFWIPSMKLVSWFAMKAAVRLFGGARQSELQSSFCEYFKFQLIQSMFEGQIKPSNGRCMWLVPAMSYTVFLNQFSHHLPVVLKPRPGNNTEIRREYLKCINLRYNALKEAFRCKLQQYLSPSTVRTHRVSPCLPLNGAPGNPPPLSTRNQSYQVNATNQMQRQSNASTEVVLLFQNGGTMFAYKVSF